MTKLDLDALEAIHAKATPGEWSYSVTPYGTCWVLDSAPAHAIACGAGYEPNTLENAAAIVAAHNALPALIARVRELEAENERFRAALTKIDELEDRCNEASSEQALIAMQALKVQP